MCISYYFWFLCGDDLFLTKYHRYYMNFKCIIIRITIRYHDCYGYQKKEDGMRIPNSIHVYCDRVFWHETHRIHWSWYGFDLNCTTLFMEKPYGHIVGFIYKLDLLISIAIIIEFQPYYIDHEAAIAHSRMIPFDVIISDKQQVWHVWKRVYYGMV